MAVGLLYKNGYFHQKINGNGEQETEYHDIDIHDLPIHPVKTEEGEDLIIYLKFPKKKNLFKSMANKCWKSKTILIRFRHRKKQPRRQRCNTTIIWWRPRNAHKTRNSIRNGRSKPTNKSIKTRANNISHERRTLIIPNIRINKNVIKEKQVSFEVARDIVSSQTVFTTHTPVPAGNDIFPISLVEKYFKDFWPRLAITREEFLKMGMKPCQDLENGFNMGILALKK